MVFTRVVIACAEKGSRAMKVRASVKKICVKCKV
ncbi:MAG: 50S ribosomal protein L36, partial [Acidobacteriales bacterium]|nr:50S ribosomal protein L36 [Terriglobales bacterium]